MLKFKEVETHDKKTVKYVEISTEKNHEPFTVVATQLGFQIYGVSPVVQDVSELTMFAGIVDRAHKDYLRLKKKYGIEVKQDVPEQLELPLGHSTR